MLSALLDLSFGKEMSTTRTVVKSVNLLKVLMKISGSQVNFAGNATHSLCILATFWQKVSKIFQTRILKAVYCTTDTSRNFKSICIAVTSMLYRRLILKGNSWKTVERNHIPLTKGP